tara:strand:+ start:346 stop:1005 length:660 start_codon:yes stop_codon:yes gene_type:complete
MSDIIKNPAQHMAIELYASQPSITAQEVAVQCNVPIETIYKWRRNINFIEAIYDRYMVQFGSELPSVLMAMVREAKAGNVQAGRLVLEHSGKLVKNVNVTIDSPFEKFLKKIDTIDDAEIVDDDQVVAIVEDLPESNDLPPRMAEDQRVRVHSERQQIKKSVKEALKRQEYNQKQKEWYNWRKRAKAVGIEPLKGRRPTKGQRDAWQKKVIEAENSKTS